jgi:hypothetical protein
MKLRILALAVLTMGMLLLASNSAFAADDPSIKGQLRTDSQKAMQKFIDDRMINGTYRIYDPKTDKVLKLTSPDLHKGIVKKAGFYVSCAGFKDQRGQKVDVDFLVLKAGNELRATQAVIHKVAGEKRPYNLASE